MDMSGTAMSGGKRFFAAMIGALIVFAASASDAAQGACYDFVDAEGRTRSIVTDKPHHDLVTAFKIKYRLAGEKDIEHAGGTTYIDEHGKNWIISAPAGAVAKSIQKDAGGVVADDCATADSATTGPILIRNAMLPYDKTFDASGATDSGDFRGSSADSISSAGGHDAFWKFTPSVSGVYSIAATAGSSAGIGVWEGTCGTLVEAATAFNLMGGGTSNLSIALTAGESYFIVWEDHFPGSVETSVRLRVSAPVVPQGEAAAEAIDLTGRHWGLGFSVAADNSANLNALHFPSEECDPDLSGEGGHGGEGGDGNDIWFRLPRVESGETYQLEGLAGTMSNSIFVLYSHAAFSPTTTDLVIESCNDDKANTGGHEGNDFMSLIEFTGDASREYYLFVESYSLGGPGNGDFMLVGSADTLAIETTTVENFFMGSTHYHFIDTGALAGDEEPFATVTSATVGSRRIDRGFDSGKWGGYITTGSLYCYNFAGATYLTSATAQNGYLLVGANTDDETGSYFYTYFPRTQLDMSYADASVEYVLRYGGGLETTTSLRLIVRSQYDSGHGTPGTWMISEPFTPAGLTSSFATAPVQHLDDLAALEWYVIASPAKSTLDALAGGDETPITIGAQIPHGVELLLSEVNGLGFYLNKNVLSSSFSSGLFFDSIALTGVLYVPPVTAAQGWSSYE